MTDANQTTITHGAGEAMRHLPVLSIARSLTNPRKHFDHAKLQELADSIQATGVHQPILVRPLPAHRVADEQTWAKAEKRERAEYELVCGERRWRASQLAGAAQIPAMIRDMTDAQALEAQVIENLQREDVTELEEAEGYQVLMEQQSVNADALGAKVGKSRAYIYARLKVLDLCAEGREAMREGKLDFSCALPIARIPNHALQLKALERAIDPNKGWNGDRMSAREVKRMVQTDFTTKLEYAQFDRDDATLCPNAGACAACPKRTGNDPSAEAGSADVCTDPPCYKAKEEAHAVRLRKQAQEMGCEIIDGREAKALVPSSFTGEVTGYLRLDSPSDSPVKGKTLRKLTHKALEASGIKPTMVVNPHNEKELIAVVRPEQAEELLKMAGKAEAHQQLQEDNKREADNAAYAQKKEAEEAYERGWRTEVARLIAVHAKEPSDTCFQAASRLVTQHLVASLNGDDAKLLCKMLELGKVAPKDALGDLANEWTFPITLAGAILAMRDRHYSPWYYEHNPQAPRNPQLMAMAEACGVDVEAVKAQVQANMRAAKAEKTAAAIAPTDAPEGDLPLTPAARAGAEGKGGKAKNSKHPAARAAEGAEKLSAATATASIAAALQALPEDAVPGAAAAAQGNEAGPVAAEAAQAPAPLVTLKRYKHVTPASSMPASELQAQSADDGQASADAKTGAAEAKVLTPATRAVGLNVRVRSNVNKKLRAMIGDKGKVTALMGDRAVLVEFPAAPRCKPIDKSFDASELEIIE